MNTRLVFVMRALWAISFIIGGWGVGSASAWLMHEWMGEWFASRGGGLVSMVLLIPIVLLYLAMFVCGDRWLDASDRQHRAISLVLVLIGTAGLMTGCATTTPVSRPTVADVPAVVATPVVEPTPVIHEPPPLVSPHEALTALSQAYQQALIRPQASDFRGIVAYLPDYPNALFALSLGYRQPLTILLPAGEVAEPVITDDWWNVTNTVSGEGANRRGVIVIQALNDRPQTSYTSIISNKTVRFLELTSLVKGRSLRAVTWEAPEPPKPMRVAWPSGVYHTDYQIEPKVGGPAWKPLQVWTIPDQQKTVILWPDAKFQRKAPVIYVLGADGQQKQVVNRRSKGRYTEIDEMFDAAELRVGHDPKNQEVAYIRAPAMTTIRCPSDPACPTPPVQGVR